MITIAALLFSSSFEPIGLWFLAPIGFAFFFKKLEGTKKPIYASFIFALISQSIILHWSGKYVGLLPWALLSLLQALFYIPVGIIYSRTRNLWFVAATILLADEIKSRFPFGGFGWTRIGFSQADSAYLNLVSLGGVAALSVVVLIFAIFFAHPSFGKIMAVLLICTLPIGFNAPFATDKNLEVAGVQGNTPKMGLDFNDRAEAVFNMHLQKTAEIKVPLDLIVWPENASDIDPYLTSGVMDKLQEMSRVKGAPILIGAVLRSGNTPTNASILLDAQSTQSTYIKQHLTPFGEYIPLRKIAEFISPYASSVTDFSPGKSYIVHKIGNFSIGPIICYEIIDDRLVRLAATKSDALVVQTNSATFAGTSESAQQLNITRIRAAEHNREILSVSTVGISALIDNNGKVITRSKENVSSIIYGTLHENRNQTLSDRLQGHGWVLIACALILIGVISRRLTGRYRR